MKSSWPVADLDRQSPGEGAPPAVTTWLRFRPLAPVVTARTAAGPAHSDSATNSATALATAAPPGTAPAPPRGAPTSPGTPVSAAPGLRLALSPLATLTSLVLEAMGARRGSPPAWFRPVRDALGPGDVAVLAPLVSPAGARPLPASLLPPPRSLRPTIEDELAALGLVPPEELVDDLQADGLLAGPWSMVARAPSRWLAGYRRALERAWTAVCPQWAQAGELLEQEAARVGVACLRAAYDDAPADRRLWLHLVRAELATFVPHGVALAPGLVVTPVLGGRGASLVARRGGALGYLGYPLPSGRRLANLARHAPGEELRQLLGGPRADLVQRVAEPQSAGALAEAMHLAPSAITHHVSILEQCGLVARERHGRHVLIRLTGRGAALLEMFGAPFAPV